ncbi:MAG: right-handed parallel beta-helix repeat-containing protein [Candidatus Heimdallarchaeaceae archaeon]
MDTIASGTAYVFNNTCTNSTQYNIYILNAPNTIVEKNSCKEGENGIRLVNCENSEIIDNTIKDIVNVLPSMDKYTGIYLS